MRRLKKRSSYSLILTAILFPVAILFFRRILGFDIHYHNDFLMKWIQLLSALAATGCGIIAASLCAFTRPKDSEEGRVYLTCISGALLSMGILTGFVATQPTLDDRYLWLELLAQVLGGIFVASSFFCHRYSKKTIPILGCCISILAAIYILNAKELPALIGESDYWTHTYVILSNLSGVPFLIGALFFIRTFSKYQRSSDLIFAHFALLSGISDIVWGGLHLWGPIWWGWHLIQLLAYTSTLFYMLSLHTWMEQRLEESEKKYRELAVEFQTLSEKLKLSNHELERFAYLASHDLHEPLRTITCFLQLVLRKDTSSLDSESQKFLSFSIEAASRLNKTIDSLLSYAKLDSTPQVLHPVDCTEVLKAVVTSIHSLVEENQARIEFEKLPTVHSDPTLLQQLFQNLVVNAIKHRSPASPRFKLEQN